MLDSLKPFYELGIKEHNIEVARKLAEEDNGNYDLLNKSVTNSKIVSETVFEATSSFTTQHRRASELESKAHGSKMFK